MKDLNERETAVEIRNQDALNDLIETLIRLSSLCVRQSTLIRKCLSAFRFSVPLHLRTLPTPEVPHPFFAEVSASERKICFHHGLCHIVLNSEMLIGPLGGRRKADEAWNAPIIGAQTSLHSIISDTCVIFQAM